MTQIEVPDSPHKRHQMYRRLTMIYNLSGEALKYLSIAELKEEQTKNPALVLAGDANSQPANPRTQAAAEALALKARTVSAIMQINENFVAMIEQIETKE